MSDLRPAASPEPARWLLRAGVDWWDLVRYGPPGFDAYVRIALDPDQHAESRDGEELGLRLTLEALAAHTTTPAVAYAAIWEGWTSTLPAPEAPRVHIPNRTMLLFRGPVGLMRDAPALAWGAEAGRAQEPHLVWPDDHAWCLACEVDEEIEFTVGCDEETARALQDALPDAVRRAGYGEAAPLYREPG
ncbi:hypothetical protein [Nocardioides dongkuii]|uniref:hypothetical protein n=1 Tax=Nocardioides dongkuii TaxID=2760089 RepID=UPI001877ABED|nr:hypothetical protein [Nocardioides dongkuii]